MTRAHFYRPVQDERGDLKGTLSVRLLEPGTTNPITDPVYSTDGGPAVHGNPWTAADSIVDFYLDTPKMVRIGVTPEKGAETYFEDMEVGAVVSLATPDPGSSLFYNVRENGVVGDGSTDDSAALRSVIADATPIGGVVYFPPGTYLVSEEGTTFGCLNLPSGARLAGPGKILMATGQRAGCRPIQNNGVSDIRIEGLTVEMPSGSGGTGSHCIQNNDSSHVYINKVKCLTGDRGGISIMGAMVHVRITECEIYSPIFNGITFYGSDGAAQNNPLEADDIVIDKCHIEAFVQPIDSEPVGGFAKNVRITNNTLIVTDPNGNYAITMTAGYGIVSGLLTPNEKWVVTGNTCLGAIAAFNTKDCTIANNTFDCRGFAWVGNPAYVVHANYVSSGNSLVNNKIWTALAGDQMGVSLVYSSTGGHTGRPVDWIVSNNEIYVNGTNATASVGINCSSCGPVIVSNNLVRGTNSGIGIWVRGSAAGQPVESAIVTGNDIDGFAVGIQGQYYAEIVKQLTITGNTIRQTTPSPTLTGGIRLVGTSAQFPQVSISGNNVDSVYGANAYVLGSVLVREGSSPGTWSGTGAPEGVVTASTGALYKRRDGGGGTTLYVKESGTNTNTGWTAQGGGGGSSAQVTARLTADVTRNNDATAFPIADLSLPVAANSKYRLTTFIIYSASAAADVAASWSVPAAAALTWTSNAAPTTASTANNTISRGINNTATIGQFGSIVAGQKIVALPVGTLTTGANAGTLQFKFAQLVADPSDAVLYADTWITLDKVA